jgi:hypothetical protein
MFATRNVTAEIFSIVGACTECTSPPALVPGVATGPVLSTKLTVSWIRSALASTLRLGSSLEFISHKWQAQLGSRLSGIVPLDNFHAARILVPLSRTSLFSWRMPSD